MHITRILGAPCSWLEHCKTAPVICEKDIHLFVSLCRRKGKRNSICGLTSNLSKIVVVVGAQYPLVMVWEGEWIHKLVNDTIGDGSHDFGDLPLICSGYTATYHRIYKDSKNNSWLYTFMIRHRYANEL